MNADPEEKPKISPPPDLQPLRRLGLLLALGVGAACGWQAVGSADLLDVVLRGAGAWLGVAALWLFGLKLVGYLLQPAPEPDTMPTGENPAAA